MPAPPVQFLDPAVLRSIQHIELKARLIVEGLYASRHRAPSYGYSVEFVDHREYVPGDEPRSIDWKMLGRTEKYFVKRFEMESNMNVVVLLDASASMGYRPAQGRDRLSKLEYASYLAASLAYLAQRQQDAPGLVTFDDAMRDFIPPKQGKRHLFTLLSKLESLSAAHPTDIARVLSLVSQRLTRRGIVILISDCYGDPEGVVGGIRHLRARGHDTIVFHLMDRDEVEFPFQALSAFRDLETGRKLLADPLRQRTLYLDKLERFCAAVQEGATGCGADYRFLDTAMPIETALREYLLYRRERGR